MGCYGPFVPQVFVDNQFVDKPWSDWTESESKKAQYDSIVKNIITSSLNLDEFFRISQCAYAKEMCDTLEVTHEGGSCDHCVWLIGRIVSYELQRTCCI